MACILRVRVSRAYHDIDISSQQRESSDGTRFDLILKEF